MLTITMGRQSEESCVVFVGVGNPELPVMSITLSEKVNGVVVAIETADAVEPNLIFERYRDARVDVYKSLLSYQLSEDSEELLLHLTEGVGPDRRHSLQVYAKDAIGVLYPNRFREDYLALTANIRQLFLAGLDVME